MVTNIVETGPQTNKIAESIVLLEEATQTLEEAIKKIENHELTSGKRLQASEAYFNKRLEEIKSTIAELREFMTQAGIARFRIVAERTLQEGKDHLLEIQKSTENFHQIVQENIEYLHRTAENASNWIADALKSLKLEDFRRLMVESTGQIEDISKTAIGRINKMTRWFQWERLGIAVAVSITTSLLTALFINDEAPWESHKHVVAERQAGQILHKAWSRLSSAERIHIQDSATGSDFF